MSDEHDLLHRPPILRKPEEPDYAREADWRGEGLISISGGQGLRDRRSSRNRLDEK